MLGVPMDGPANVFCDNNGVVKNTTIPESMLTKKHNAMACPRPKQARRTRLDADDIVNRQMTSRQTQTSRQRNNQANVEERN